MMDLDLNAFYFHSIILGKDDTLKVLDSILKSKKILSLNKGGYDDRNIRMNFRDEICLSKKNNLNISSGAYDLFAMKKLTLIIKGSLPGVYKPLIVSEKDSYYFVEMGKTDLEGEYRVKDEISLDYVVGLNLPVSFVLDSMFGYKYFFCSGEEMRKMRFVSNRVRYDEIVSFYKDVRSIMNSNGVSLPIYDIGSGVKLNDSSDIVKCKKRDKLL